MKEVLRIYWFLLFLFLVTSLAHGQVRRDQASRIRFGTALPATCNPDIGSVFFLITPGSPLGMHQCLSTDSYTPMVGSMSGAGADNQIAVFTGPTDIEGTAALLFDSSTNIFGLVNDAARLRFGAAQDAQIAYDGTGELAMRGPGTGDNANFWYVYDHFNDATNYDRLAMYSGGPPPKVFELEVQTVGTGADSIDLKITSAGSGSFIELDTGGSSQWTLQNSIIRYTPDNTIDIGASGSLRPQDGFFTGRIVLASLLAGQSAALKIEHPVVGAPGQQDSHFFTIVGASDDGAPHTIDWQTFVDVTANDGTGSIWTLQAGIDGSGFSDQLTVEVGSSALGLPQDTASIRLGAALDAQIHRGNAADIVEQRRGLNNQQWNIYDRFVSFADYDRLSVYVGGGPPVKIFAIEAETTDGATGGIDLRLEAVPGSSGGVVRLVTGTASVQLNQQGFTFSPANQVSVSNVDNFAGGGTMDLGLAETSSLIGIDLRIAAISPGTGQRDSHSISLSGRSDDGNPFEAQWHMQVVMDSDSGDSSFVLSERVNCCPAFDTAMSITNTISNPGQFTLPNRGPHAFGIAIDFQHQFTFGNDYVGTLGADLTAVKFRLENNVTASDGTTTSIYGMDLDVGLRTQAATEVVADMATLNIEEPNIIVNLGGGQQVTRAATLRIGGAPNEAANNFAIMVMSGNSQFAGLQMTSAGRASIRNENPSATNPVFLPDGSNLTSGLGGTNSRVDLITNSISRVSVGADNLTDFIVSIGGLFTADPGGGTDAYAIEINPLYTGVTGHTNNLSLMRIDGSVTTQTAVENINNISTLDIREPEITDNLTGVITDAATLRIQDAPTEGTNNYALFVETGLSSFGGDVEITGNIDIAGVGPHSIAGTPSGAIQLIISDTFTSDGSSTLAAGIFHTTAIVGAAGDTTSLTGTTLTAGITTQTATESIADIAQLQVNEPFITDNLTGTITNASTLLITGAPTEGTNNYALRVVTGATLLGGELEHTGTTLSFFSTTPATQPAAYTRNATIVEDRTLLASASATTLNNNNVLAALIADLQSLGLIQ